MAKLEHLITLVLLLCFSSCVSNRTVERQHTPVASLLDESVSSTERLALATRLEEESPYLKAHMLNGQVYVLSEREIDAARRIVQGAGVLLDVHRDTLDQGTFSIPLDSVAIFETNVLENSGPATALAIITGASLALTAYCAANPKACFGSCPTFYVSDGDSLLLQAEGFSSSIAPSLEARDVDALYRTRPDRPTVQVEMRNEALETHVVRYVNLLLAPKPERGRVLVDSHDNFWHAPILHEPRACVAGEGDCLPSVRAFDGHERFSTTDSTDLATRELIDLVFDEPPEGSLGLVVGARQTLLTTYLLYQTLAYMGRDVGAWFARIERRDKALRDTGLGRILGGIEVLVQDSTGAWIVVEEIHEHGPLAPDVHLVPLPPLPSEAVRLRLRLTRGNWRLDYIALAELGTRVEPLRLQPSVVYRDGTVDDHARALLHDTKDALTTLPGDTYTLVYEMPQGDGPYELFLESRGYYLEWIREEWLKEEDPRRLARMLFAPQVALRELAPEYKRVEAQMEDAFWRSRYAKR